MPIVMRILSGFGVTVSALCLLAAGGCASAAKEIGGAATPVVVKSGLATANEADSQKQLQKLLASPAFQKFGQDVGEGVGVGLFNQANKLTGGDATATVATDSATPVGAGGAAGAAGTGGAGATTGPTSQPGAAATKPGKVPASKTAGAAAVGGLFGGGGVNGLVKSSVQEAFLAATDPQFKKGEEAMSEAIGEGFVSGMITVLNKKGPDLAETIRKQLGPIVQELIRNEIAPAVREMIEKQISPAALGVWREGAVETLKLTVRPDLQPDVVQNAKNASIGASRGTHEVLIESGVLNENGAFAPHVKLYIWSGVVVLSLIGAATMCLLLLLNLIAFRLWRQGKMKIKAAA